MASGLGLVPSTRHFLHSVLELTTQEEVPAMLANPGASFTRSSVRAFVRYLPTAGNGGAQCFNSPCSITFA